MHVPLSVVLDHSVIKSFGFSLAVNVGGAPDDGILS
eukprot:CAMPEP_0174384874 /NCGR_PEP_ID=MMETSP0811_2-20130205/126206_1 /TAXON_ID=73025 ORGANISM="Eutreptiella gymnastica-like, Strain CCMP1594" /NCGR_SAMPLE_ID=MMETSP0811_2 /ASSEMBLY_ACC=CAM_ASM_000667 /LENGTH=35 /DNA_ID= /DNA_START= /DNA_END= /DNA_ORIENTATION=